MAASARLRDAGSSRKLVHRAGELAGQMSGWPDEKLRVLQRVLAGRLAAGESSDAPIVEALAAVREAVRRVHGQHLTDECVLAGLLMADGQVVDLAVSMDRYLISAVPAFLSVLRGHAVHAVSLDSARARDWSERLDGVLAALGLFSDRLVSPPDRVARKDTYGADVVYGGYEEFGYDYLRDNLAATPDHCVQQGNLTAIVDGAETILLRHIGQRLVIIRPMASDPEYYYKTATLAGSLIRGDHFELDEQTGDVSLNMDRLPGETRPAGGAWTARREWELANAIRARTWYRAGTDFSVQRGAIAPIDRPDSRLRGDQGYAEGIRQALEAHAGVRITPVQLPQARITIRDYFRTYAALSGWSSGGAASASELQAAYGVQVANVRGNSGQSSEDERCSRENFERQLAWLKLEAEIEGEQRERFYAKRRELIRKPDLRRCTSSLLEDVIDSYLRRYPSPNRLLQALFRLYETPLAVGDLLIPSAQKNTGEYDTALRAQLYEDIRMAYETREQLLGPDVMRRLEERVIVPVLDEGWCLYLAELDAIFRLARSRPGAEFASIYRSRAQESYKTLLDHTRENIAGYLFHLEDTA